MHKFLTILSVILFTVQAINAQVSDRINFQTPLKIPLYLSGNFGELRSAHFHAGLDFKTQATTGHPVYAISEGYISRIKVQSGGYGHSLYITHPNGLTSVYAHLDRYIPELQKYLVSQQYQAQSYEIELFPMENQFSFKAGDLIAYSGNTGSSGGPHLHLEIRRTSGQVPLNGLKYNFPVTDNQNPVFTSAFLYVYRQQEPNAIQVERIKINPLVKKSDTSYVIDKVIEIDGSYLGIGAEVYDFLNGSGNKCGIYTLHLAIDGQTRYGFCIDEISFAQTGYINAHMDYDLKNSQGIEVHRLFALPNNELSIYDHVLGNGIFALKDFEQHSAEIIATDVYGNRSRLTFDFRRKESSLFDFSVPEIEYLVEWMEGRQFRKENLLIDIPPRALYQDLNFTYNIIKGESGVYSDSFQIHNQAEPLHKNIIIRLAMDSIAPELAEKTVFARVNGSNKLVCEGGEYTGGFLTLSTKKFDTYFLKVDTAAPQIEPKGYYDGRTYRKGDTISFILSDDLSGIKSYGGYIDDKWALFSFDAKTGKFSYEIDPGRLISGNTYNLRIEVMDNKDNKNILSGKFLFQDYAK